MWHWTTIMFVYKSRSTLGWVSIAKQQKAFWYLFGFINKKIWIVNQSLCIGQYFIVTLYNYGGHREKEERKMESSWKLCSLMSWLSDCGELEEVLCPLSYGKISNDNVTDYLLAISVMLKQSWQKTRNLSASFLQTRTIKGQLCGSSGWEGEPQTRGLPFIHIHSQPAFHSFNYHKPQGDKGDGKWIKSREILDQSLNWGGGGGGGRELMGRGSEIFAVVFFVSFFVFLSPDCRPNSLVGRWRWNRIIRQLRIFIPFHCSIWGNFSATFF